MKSKQKIPNNTYVLLARRGCYALVKSRVEGSKYTVKVPASMGDKKASTGLEKAKS